MYKYVEILQNANKMSLAKMPKSFARGMSKDCCIIEFVEDDNCTTSFLQTVDINLIMCHKHVRILGCFELFSCFVLFVFVVLICYLFY